MPSLPIPYQKIKYERDAVKHKKWNSLMKVFLMQFYESSFLKALTMTMKTSIVHWSLLMFMPLLQPFFFQPQYKCVYPLNESKMFTSPISVFQYKWYGACERWREEKLFSFSFTLFLSARMFHLWRLLQNTALMNDWCNYWNIKSHSCRHSMNEQTKADQRKVTNGLYFKTSLRAINAREKSE